MNVELRGVIHFCWLKDLTPQKTLNEMKEAYQSRCPSFAMMYKWFKQFDKGRKNVNDLPRVGRPLTKDIRDHIERFIGQFPWSSCRYIAFTLNISRETVKKCFDK